MLGVDVPKIPTEAPDSGDVVNWGDKFGNWLTDMSPTTMKLIVIAIVAAMIAGALRKSPFLKGAVIGVIIVGIAIMAFTS